MNFSTNYRFLLTVIILCSFSIFATNSLKISDIEAEILEDKVVNVNETSNKVKEEQDKASEYQTAKSEYQKYNRRKKCIIGAIMKHNRKLYTHDLSFVHAGIHNSKNTYT